MKVFKKQQVPFRSWVLTLFLFSFLGASAQGVLKIHQYQLPNGLTVILNEDHSTPEVFGLVVVKAGGKNDPADATGLAHYMEHMLFKGTQTLGTTSWEKEKPHLDRILELYDQLGATSNPVEREKIQIEINKESLAANEYVIPNELSDLINSMGGTQLNAGTSPDMTVFFNKFPSNQIFRWIDLYAHRFKNPVFRGFQAELEVVYEEKNLYNDQFQTKLIDEFQKSFFKNHPYGQQPLIGTIEHLKNPSLRRMYEFYNTYYVANNMALVISGHFNTNEILPFIEEKFGQLPAGQLPERKVWNEQPFKGREFVKARLSPIKIGIMGFRSPTSSDSDYAAMQVCMQILNNRTQTGLLDRLTIEGKVLTAQAIQLPYLDHGATLVLLVPKIIGQKTIEAENLATVEIAKLANGEFDDWLLNAAKLNLYSQFEREIERIDGRALKFADAFVTGKTIEEAMAYSDQIMAITREDIQRVASKYFGPDFLAFHSKTGFPKKEKIAKPNFEALTPKSNEKSTYAAHFQEISTKELTFAPINFETDIAQRTISKGIDLFVVENPYNDIFSLTMQFQVGEHHIPLLDKATEMMTFAGTQSKSVSDYKAEFAKIGCSYQVWSDKNYTSVKIEGIERNLPKAIALIDQLLVSPKLEQQKLKILLDGEKTNRKVERSEPDNVAAALFDYVRFGNSSDYLSRPTLKQLKALKADQLVNIFQQATSYPVKIHYVGKLQSDSVKQVLASNLTLNLSGNRVETPIAREAKVFSENTIFVVNKKKARQSKVFFFANGENFNPSDEWLIDAFNEYFGGGFSGLVLQEIREYRSLAYGAGAQFYSPLLNNKPVNFIGYLATQADKTLIAIETFDGLIKQMPQKPERISMIRDYLVLSAQTERPSFRNMSMKVEEWKIKGFSIDPTSMKLPQYNQLQWEEIYKFYQKRLQAQPYVIALVGDTKHMDLKKLQRYGKIVMIKEEILFSK